MKDKEKTKHSRKKAIDKRNRNEIYSTSNLTAPNREHDSIKKTVRKTLAAQFQPGLTVLSAR